MDTIRNTIVAVVGLGIAVLTLVVMSFVGLAVIGFAAVAGLVGLLMARFGRRPVRRRPDEPRVWNDGRGTIIDM